VRAVPRISPLNTVLRKDTMIKLKGSVNEVLQSVGEVSLSISENYAGSDDVRSLEYEFFAILPGVRYGNICGNVADVQRNGSQRAPQLLRDKTILDYVEDSDLVVLQLSVCHIRVWMIMRKVSTSPKRTMGVR
jgi:hypothetical protein